MRGSLSAIWITCLMTVGCTRGQPASPVPAEQLDQFKATVNTTAMQCKEDTTTLGEASDKYRQLAEQAASNSEYERLAPREAAIAYRLYAAYLIMQPSGRGVETKCRDALPWVRRALQTHTTVGDHDDLKLTERFLTASIGGSAPNQDKTGIFQHIVRLAMVEASREQVDAEADRYKAAAGAAMTPRGEGGSSPSEDVDYLEAYGKGETTIDTCLKAMKLRLMTDAPGKEIGPTRYINPMPNGNTRVGYKFHGKVTILLEWEVSKAKGLVLPKTEAARAIMTLVDK